MLRVALMAAALLAAGSATAADTPQYKILSRIKVADGSFDYATFDPVSGLVFMPRGAFTTVLNVRTGQASELKTGASDHIALPIPDSNLLVLTQRRGTIRIIDRTTDTVVADLAGGKNPNSAVYDPATKLAFVFNKDSGNVTLVDPLAKKAVGVMPVSPNTLEFPVTDGRGRIFDNIETTAEIAVIDARQRKVTGSYKLAGCEEPTGLAYAEGLLVSSCGNGVAKIVAASDGHEIASLPIGHGPDAVIYDPVHKTALIPCGADGLLEVISLADPMHPRLTQHVRTQQGSRTGTVDPRSGRVYLMASKPDTAAPPTPTGRVPRLAGSWEILVVGLE